MTVRTILTLLLAGCASCALFGVPEHVHLKSLAGSCEESCAPGACASAFDVDDMQAVPCDSAAAEECVCQGK